MTVLCGWEGNCRSGVARGRASQTLWYISSIDLRIILSTNQVQCGRGLSGHVTAIDQSGLWICTAELLILHYLYLHIRAEWPKEGRLTSRLYTAVRSTTRAGKIIGVLKQFWVFKFLVF